MAKKAIRPIRIEGNIAYVPLTQGYEAIIDAADVPLVDGWFWQALVSRSRHDGSIRTVYAVRDEPRGDRQRVYMHRVILNTPPGMYGDHVNGDGLDNRRENLRVASLLENNKNARCRRDSSSGVKGVWWQADANKWRASIRANNVKVYLGLFASKEEAARAYAEASARVHGEWGRTE